MLTVSKIYRIVDDKNDTRITIEKDGGIYRWEVKNADGDELGFDGIQRIAIVVSINFDSIDAKTFCAHGCNIHGNPIIGCCISTNMQSYS